MVGRNSGRARRAAKALRHPRAFLRSRPRALERRVRTYFGEPNDLTQREAALSDRIRAVSGTSRRQPGEVTRPFEVAPVVGRVTSGFGDRFGRMHYGADFAVPEGTPIRAPADGAVVLVERMAEYGTTTVLSHGDGVTTLCAHQARADVRVGGRVQAGEPIGLVGSTGRVTGPHLHFEVRIDGVPLDPVPLLPESTSDRHTTVCATATGLDAALTAQLGPVLAGSRRVVLVGFPTNVNPGDALIWQGQIALLRRLGIEIVDTWPKDVPGRAFRRLPGDVAVILAGGGSFGDLWPSSQLARERTIRAAAGRRVVQFPQSLCYRDTSNVEATREVLTDHDDIVLTWRDDASYQAALELFPETTSIMVPDVAFAAGPLRRRHDAESPVVCIARTDHEGGDLAAIRLEDTSPRGWCEAGAVSNIVRTTARADFELERRGGRVLTHRMRRRLCDTAATVMVDAANDKASSGHVVVSDRLHAHVFCTMLGIRHVMVDTRYGKISAFIRTWTADSELVTLADSPRAAVEAAQALAAGS